MQPTDDLGVLFKHELKSFLARAVVRELHALLLDPKKPGQCLITVEEWSADWEVSPACIWQVIDFMTDQGLWQISQEGIGDVLRCAQTKSASTAIKRKAKRLDLQKIRKAAQADRSADLGLTDVQPSAVSDMCKRIPFPERAQALREGYAGWLPTDRYGLDGTVFVINQGLADQLRAEFEHVDIEAALRFVFDDLRAERMERPKPAIFPFWLRNWLKKNADTMCAPSDEAISVDSTYEVSY